MASHIAKVIFPPVPHRPVLPEAVLRWITVPLRPDYNTSRYQRSQVSAESTEGHARGRRWAAEGPDGVGSQEMAGLLEVAYGVLDLGVDGE